MKFTKKTIALFSLSFSLSLGAIVFSGFSGKALTKMDAASSYSMTLDSARNKVKTSGEASATEDYGLVMSATGYEVKLAFKNLATYAGGWQTLNKDGVLYNKYLTDRTASNKMSGLSSVVYSGSANLKIQGGWVLENDSVISWDAPETLSSGTYNFVGSPDFFKITNPSGSAVNINSLVFNYSCTPVTHVGPKGTFVGRVNLSVGGASYPFSMSLGHNHLYVFKVSNTSIEPTDYYYNAGTGKLTFPTNGSFTYGTYTLKYGTVTATYNSATDQISNFALTGSISSYVSSLTAGTRPTVYDNLNGTTADMQSKYVRRYNSGSWQIDNSNSDRLEKNTYYAIDGNSSMKIRLGGAGYKTGLASKDDNHVAWGNSLKNISFWYRSNRGFATTLRVYIYKAAGYGTNSQIVEWSIPSDNSWHYYECGFSTYLGASDLYAFQLYHEAPSTGIGTQYTSIDCISLW